MRRAQSHRSSSSSSSTNEEEEQEDEPEVTNVLGGHSGGHRVLNLQHYVGHALVKQRHGTAPSNFRTLSRAVFHQKNPNNNKLGLKQAHSHGSNISNGNSNGSKSPELTGLQRRAAELTGVPLINFNIKRSPPPVRVAGGMVDISAENNDPGLKVDSQVKYDGNEFRHQPPPPPHHPPLYQSHQYHQLMVQQHLRFLTAYQHSGLLAMRSSPDLPPDTSSPPPSVSPPPLPPSCPPSLSTSSKFLRKNYSLCEDMLLDSTLKSLWDMGVSSDYGYNVNGENDNLNNGSDGNGKVNFRLGATLSLPQMLMVHGSDASSVAGLGHKDCGTVVTSGNDVMRQVEFQMGKEDEARFLPTDLLCDEGPELNGTEHIGDDEDKRRTEMMTRLETGNSINQTKSLPVFSLIDDNCIGRKSTLRKTVSLHVDQFNNNSHNNNNNNLFLTSDFSLFPQTSQSDLLCSLRSSLVKNSSDLFGSSPTQLEQEFFIPLPAEMTVQNRKMTSSTHLERAIKSLSINSDISRKF